MEEYIDVIIGEFRNLASFTVDPSGFAICLKRKYFSCSVSEGPGPGTAKFYWTEIAEHRKTNSRYADERWRKRSKKRLA